MRFSIPFSSKQTWVRFLFILLPLICLTLPINGRFSPSIVVKAAPPTVWSLVWSDEFNGPSGAAVDATKWTAEIGGGGWGNNELEYYTSRVDNAYQSDGLLVIKAIKESYAGSQYTSARLITRNKFSPQYGRFEARIKLPFGQGIWPAFWMLGNDIGTVGWPQCGEIDILENIGKEPTIIHGTIHGPGYSGEFGIGSSYSLPNNQRFADAFHTFAVEWEPNVVRFYCDGILYKTLTPANLPAGKTWVYNHPFFILMNLAVGGYWPGYPDATTVFPQTMLVDYVRVYQRATPSSTPVMLTEEGSNHAVALDSVLFTQDPFKVTSNNNFSLDHHTRVMLLVANVDLLPGDNSVTAEARDAQGTSYPLIVEAVEKVPSFEWITQVVVILPDGLKNLSEVQVSVKARGQPSNEALVRLIPQ